MKKIVTVLTIMSMVIGCFGATSKNHVLTDKFIDALIRVESNGRDNAIGDNGKAVGCLQIWPDIVTDVNRISNKKFTLNDRYDRNKSIEMFKIYIGHYAVERRIGRSVTNQDIARIWNGGPNGWRKKSTLGYWYIVKQYMQNEYNLISHLLGVICIQQIVSNLNR